MPLEITRKRRQQRKITAMSFLLSGLFFVCLFVFMRATGLDEVLAHKILEIAEAIAPPPPPPPPPPDVKANVKAPPKIDMNFDVKTILNRPNLSADFDLGALSNFSADMEAPDLTMAAMEFSSNDLSNLVSNAQLPVIGLMGRVGFDVGAVSTEERKGSARGQGKRTSGSIALAVLDIPGNEEDSKWSEGELETIADFISRNTSMKAQLGARAISFLAPYSSYNAWLRDAKQRALSEYRELPPQEPEIAGLEILANCMPYIEEGDHEHVKARIKRLVTSYLRIKFEARLTPETDSWTKKIESATPLKDFQKPYLREAEKAYKSLYAKKKLNGKEAKGLYMMFRVFELMQLPVLFCEPRGVLDMPLAENRRLLKTYVRNGGFIYFCNTADFKVARAIVGLITELTGEQLADPVGGKTLARLRKADQDVSGYVFREPEPLMAHPWTFFPMILPRKTNVSLTIFNKIGNVVFADTLRNLNAGAYLQKYRHYRWFCVDNQGNPVESGYYVYQLKSDLCVKTGRMRVSVLRQLPNGKHGIFSSYYRISEVPSKTTAKSEDLSYGEQGVFGVSLRGRLVICFTEGYKEKDPIGDDDPSAKEAALKWMTNVVIHAMAEGSLAR